MWLVFAFLSAFFAGLTAVLCKIGIKNVDSNTATALRTIVVFFFSWIIVVLFLPEPFKLISQIELKTLVFLILSGFSTGASWLCYFKALQLGDINKIAPIDKSSTVLTMILAMIFLNEEISFVKIIGMLLIGTGTYFMVMKKDKKIAIKSIENHHTKDKTWLFYAVLSAVFASLTAILGKIGIKEVDSNLGTAIRTTVVLIMAWIVVGVAKKEKPFKNLNPKNILFITLSGVATGASWLCYYKALKDGSASVVVPIDKLSILITVAFAYFILKEKLSKIGAIGLVLITLGTLILLWSPLKIFGIPL